MSAQTAPDDKQQSSDQQLVERVQQGDKRVPFSIPFSALNKFTSDSIYMGDNSIAHILGKEYKGNDKF